MKNLKYSLWIGLALSLVACGKSGSDKDSATKDSVSEPEVEQEQIIVAETADVSGDLGDYYKVVEREYTPVGSAFKKINVELERTDKEFPFNLDGYMIEPYGTIGDLDIANFGFGIEFLDSKGNILDSSPATSFSNDPTELIKLKPGEKSSVEFYMPTGDDGKKVAKFRMSSAYELHKGSGISNSSDSDYSDSSVSGSSSGSNWDSVLDEYEAYVKKYKALMDRVSNGDTNAYSELSSLSQTGTRLANKLSKASGSMTPAQQARYQRILSESLN